MTRLDRRLTDLEIATGGSEAGMALHYAEQPMARLVKPEARNGEAISLADFETEYPDGVLVEVNYVELPIKN